jgi:hypothetical protein
VEKREDAMLRKQKEPKAKKSVAGEDRAELLKVERMLRTFAATEK